MAHYTNKDQKNLEQLIEEGWMDRFKARGAGALGAAKGLGQQVKGGVQQALGQASSKIGQAGAKAFGGSSENDFTKKGDDLSNKGLKNVEQGQASGRNSKIDYLKKNITSRIDKLSADIQNDLDKLGLDVGNIQFVSEIEQALENLKSGLQTSSPSPRQSSATPPPLPTRQISEPEEDEPENPTEYSYKDIVNQRRERGKQAALKRKNPANPKKGKVKKDPLAKYAAPEQEEDLDELFWK